MAKVKRYRGMTAEQLAEATKEFEVPGFVPTPSGKMSPKLKATERRIRNAIRQRGPGRPKVGEGAERVLVSIEGGLLSEADKFAKDKGMSRSEMIAAGLRMVMGKGKRTA